MLAHIWSGTDGSTLTWNFCPKRLPKIEKREAVGRGKGVFLTATEKHNKKLSFSRLSSKASMFTWV